jgi:hypothetical protein
VETLTSTVCRVFCRAAHGKDLALNAFGQHGPKRFPLSLPRAAATPLFPSIRRRHCQLSLPRSTSPPLSPPQHLPAGRPATCSSSPAARPRRPPPHLQQLPGLPASLPREHLVGRHPCSTSRQPPCSKVPRQPPAASRRPHPAARLVS